MSSMGTILRRHQLTAYFILTFLISWGAILAFFGLGGLPAAADQAQVIGMALLLGPAGAMVIMSALLDGRDGFGVLLKRLRKWKIGGRNYAFALLTAPVTAMATLLLLSIFDSQFLPKILTAEGKVSLLLMGAGAGLFIGFFEELGWTGFAIPRLLESRGVVASGVLTGLVWGLWHFPPFWQTDTFSAALPLILLGARLFTWIVAFRVLMAWLYKRTESLLAVILMHMSLVICMIAIEPPLEGGALLAYILSWTVLLMGVGAIAVKSSTDRWNIP